MGAQFGDRLRMERRRRGMTQSELAREYCSPSYISMLEAGLREPSIEVMRELARRLNVIPQDLEFLDQTTIDTARQGVLEALSAREAWDVRDYARAEAHAFAAAALALEADRFSDWWTMGVLRVDSRMKRGDFSGALILIQDMAGHPGVAGSDILTVQAHQMRAEAHLGLGEPQRALAEAKLALSGGGHLAVDTPFRIRSLILLIRALNGAGRLQEAWESCRLLESGIDLASGGQLAGHAAWVIGDVAFLRADSATGLRYHELATRLLSPANDVELWGRFNLDSAAACLSAGIAEPWTLAMLDRADLALQVIGGGRRQDQLEIKLHRARWSYLLGDLTTATVHLDAVIEERQALGHCLAGEAARLQGKLLEALGRHGRALEFLEEARMSFSQAGAWGKAHQCIDAGLEIRIRHPEAYSPQWTLA